MVLSLPFGQWLRPLLILCFQLIKHGPIYLGLGWWLPFAAVVYKITTEGADAALAFAFIVVVYDICREVIAPRAVTPGGNFVHSVTSRSDDDDDDDGSSVALDAYYSLIRFIEGSVLAGLTAMTLPAVFRNVLAAIMSMIFLLVPPFAAVLEGICAGFVIFSMGRNFVYYCTMEDKHDLQKAVNGCSYAVAAGAAFAIYTLHDQMASVSLHLGLFFVASSFVTLALIFALLSRKLHPTDAAALLIYFYFSMWFLATDSDGVSTTLKLNSSIIGSDNRVPTKLSWTEIYANFKLLCEALAYLCSFGAVVTFIVRGLIIFCAYDIRANQLVDSGEYEKIDVAPLAFRFLRPISILVFLQLLFRGLGVMFADIIFSFRPVSVIVASLTFAFNVSVWPHEDIF